MEPLYEPCEDESTALQAFASGPLSETAPKAAETVGDLVRALSAAFPPADAEPWDRTGLLAGDPAWVLERVAVALDPTVEAVREAADLGCTVLLTHHPAFIEPPVAFGPLHANVPVAGAVVYEAVRLGVALVNYHTTLDVSAPAQGMLPGILRLARTGVLEPLARDARLGYGQICSVPEDQAPLTLGELTSRCTAVFGRAPRVWGNANAPLSTVVTWTGGAGDAAERCVERGVDALVCGEVKYHAALDASARGLGIIDLGHDVSELPFVTILAESAVRAGVCREKIVFVNRTDAWTHPESRRV